jgi:hypothetical protein
VDKPSIKIGTRQFFDEALVYRNVIQQGKFTPLESRSIDAGDGGNRNHQLLIEGGVKARPFLTGFTFTKCENIKAIYR